MKNYNWNMIYLYANSERLQQCHFCNKKRTKSILNNNLLQDNDVSKKNNECLQSFILTNQTIHNDDNDK